MVPDSKQEHIRCRGQSDGISYFGSLRLLKGFGEVGFAVLETLKEDSVGFFMLIQRPLGWPYKFRYSVQ